MQKYIRNNKEINVHQYTDEFKNELITNGIGEFEDIYFIIIQGMTDTEFEWDFFKKQLRIVYSDYNNYYENVTKDNFRDPQIINIGDYIIKEDGIYHLETKEYFENTKKYLVV